MSLPSKVKVVEVGPRDGLQSEADYIATDVKIDFINQLSMTGLTVIEATSFVSPKWIPQFSDNKEVYEGIKKYPGIRYPVLVPNVKGFETALAAGVKEVAVFCTPSEKFSQHNTNCSVSESISRIAHVMQAANRHAIPVRGYISCVLGCPYEGKISADSVAELALRLHDMGCYEISLGDTIGVGTPDTTLTLLEAVTKDVPVSHIGAHFHDTYAMALTNLYVALNFGVSVIDSSIAGLGGCPYAKGATGNVATEDVVYLLESLGIESGVDLKKLITVGRFISKFLNRPPQSKVNLALYRSSE